MFLIFSYLYQNLILISDGTSFKESKNVLWFENYNDSDIVTPVNVTVLEKLLIQSKYCTQKTKYLIKGFTEGFQLEYEGPRDQTRKSKNLNLRVGSKTELWNKVMKEVELGCYAGPYKENELPFSHFIQSPIGLVPKDGGRKTRLIFHLSHPRNGNYSSVNECILKEKCMVAYPDFEEAVKLCLQEGKSCKMGKSDMSSAFHHVPISSFDWNLMTLKAEHPISGVVFYFFDKCLPFGSSISCTIFQVISDAISHLVSFRTRKRNINYLDDYFFAALKKLVCDWQVDTFIQVCEEISFPVALEKTFWGTTVIVFLGLLLDSERQVVCIPVEKIQKTLEMIAFFLNGRNKKATVHQIQKLCGLLNFLCHCVIPGHAFTRRLYSVVASNMKPHHHIKISDEMRLDIQVWQRFLMHPDIFCRPFLEFGEFSAEDIQMFSDASRNFSLGFGAMCNKSWTFGQWDHNFMEVQQPSIEYLELFAVTVAVVNWIRRFNNKRINLFCDNESVVHMINGSSSTCKNCMVLIRLIVFEGLIRNVRIFAKHIPTKKNGIVDALSRMQFNRFWKLAPDMEEIPTQIPQELWPLQKIWKD